MAENLSFHDNLTTASLGLVALTGNVKLNTSGATPTIVSGSSLSLPALGSGIPAQTYSSLAIAQTGTTAGGVPIYTVTGTSTTGLTTISVSFAGTAPTSLISAAASTIPTVITPSVTLASATSGAITPTAVCFAAGTRILTTRGNVAIDNLEVGDVAITASGEERSIRYLAHRTFECRRSPRPQDVLPVRISAHAFGEGLPSRDLVVSPGHSICTKVVSDVLIPAVALINGSTIQQLDVDEVEYWHVELDSHDIVLAENLPAESYLDMGNRDFFAKDGVVALDEVPDIDPASRTHADFCRPFRAEGSIVEAVREQLHEQAAALGWGLSDGLDVRLEVDGRRVEPVVRGDKIRFEIPAGATDVWLVSGTARPCDTMKTAAFDDRNLGLCIGALRIDDGFGPAREIAVDDPLLCIGFYGVEAGPRRWTAGRARLPVALWAGCEPGFYLVVEMAATPVPRWQKRAESGNVIALVAA